MSRVRAFASRLLRDNQGAYALEFALVAPALIMTMCLSLEFGYQSWVRSTAIGRLNQMTRNMTLNGADATTQENAFKAQIQNLVKNPTITMTKISVRDFSGLETAERLVSDVGNNGYIAGTGDCYEDVDNNNVRDSNAVREDNVGGADDIVIYTAVITYPRILTYLPWDVGNATMTLKSFAQRQPFEAQASPPIKCN